MIEEYVSCAFLLTVHYKVSRNGFGEFRYDWLEDVDEAMALELMPLPVEVKKVASEALRVLTKYSTQSFTSSDMLSAVL